MCVEKKFIVVLIIKFYDACIYVSLSHLFSCMNLRPPSWMRDAVITYWVPFEIYTTVNKGTAIFRSKIQRIVYWRSRQRDPLEVSNPYQATRCRRPKVQIQSSFCPPRGILRFQSMFQFCVYNYLRDKNSCLCSVDGGFDFRSRGSKSLGRCRVNYLILSTLG